MTMTMETKPALMMFVYDSPRCNLHFKKYLVHPIQYPCKLCVQTFLYNVCKFGQIYLSW